VEGRRPAGRPAVDRLAAFRDPGTGRWLVRREEVLRFAADRLPPTVVIGYDLVCSAPKSVSLLWAFADAGLRADIAAAFDAAVDAAVGYLDRHAAVGTVGGANRPGLGLAVASYRHEVSRADEAHRPAHALDHRHRRKGASRRRQPQTQPRHHRHHPRPLPPGAYTIDVTGLGPNSPVAPVSSDLLVWG